MGRVLLIAVGVLFALWLVFAVIGMVIAALKWLLFVAVVGFVITVLVVWLGRRGKATRS